ncbi:MAG: hypothetical protein PVH84_01050 [Candidatus Aminicenantes bacterium]
MTGINSKKLLKEKSVKFLDDFNAFMRDDSKDVIETLLDEEQMGHVPIVTTQSYPHS